MAWIGRTESQFESIYRNRIRGEIVRRVNDSGCETSRILREQLLQVHWRGFPDAGSWLRRGPQSLPCPLLRPAHNAIGGAADGRARARVPMRNSSSATHAKSWISEARLTSSTPAECAPLRRHSGALRIGCQVPGRACLVRPHAGRALMEGVSKITGAQRPRSASGPCGAHWWRNVASRSGHLSCRIGFLAGPPRWPWSCRCTTGGPSWFGRCNPVLADLARTQAAGDRHGVHRRRRGLVRELSDSRVRVVRTDNRSRARRASAVLEAARRGCVARCRRQWRRNFSDSGRCARASVGHSS
jgi:hypothetical protein